MKLQAIPPKLRFVDNNGIALAGGKVYTYDGGTTTPKATYADADGGTPNANPVILDSRGEAGIWLSDGMYKFVVKDSADSTIYTVDDISNEASPTITSLAASDGASKIGFIQFGTGAQLRDLEEKEREQICIFDNMTDAQIADVQAGTLAVDLYSVFAGIATDYRGCDVKLPKGKYLINTNGGSLTLEEIRLVGEGVLDGATGTLDQGSILCFTGTTNSPFKIRRGVSMEGLGFYYPNQADSATPTAYPPTLDFDYTNGAVQFVDIRDNVVYNAYRFIRMDDATGNVGHIWIEDNVIYGIKSCIELTHNLEVIKIRGNNFTFGHWLAATEGGCRGYTRSNGQVFVTTAKTDGFIFSDNMAYGYRDGVAFETTGICQLANIATNLFDQVRYAITASGTGNVTGLQIGGNSFVSFNGQNTAQQGRAISITTSGSGASEIITISGANTFSFANEDAIYVSGNTPVRVINISGGTFNGWAAYKAAGDYGALNINGNNTSFNVTGAYFAASNAYSSGILGSCSAANIVGNTFLSCKAAINAAYGGGSAVGNSSYATGGTYSDLTSGLTQSGNTWDKPQSWIDTATAATYTLPINVKTVICNRAGTITVTLPTAAANAGRRVKFRTITANTVVSASSNIVPIAGGAAGTAMLAASAGAWCELECDGTSWQIIAA